jgi:hypothetical protein
MNFRTLFALTAVLSVASNALSQGRGGGIPNVTPEQTAALTQMNVNLTAVTQALTAARGELVATALAQPRNDAAIRAKAQAIGDAEAAVAIARADAFARIQASSNKLAPDQVAALAGDAARGGRGGGGRGAVGVPDLSPGQGSALVSLNSRLASFTQTVNTARAEVTSASYKLPRNDTDIKAKADAVAGAEAALAGARAGWFATLQASPNQLAPNQVAALIARGGALPTGFTEPDPMDFNDHFGYVSLFDGVSLKGWDGNPKFWRAEGGAIVGESTPENPSGNTYIVYRDVEAHDFTLKFEMKIEGNGGSGLQYRSKTGIPWSRPIAANVIANTGPVNLNWMMTGPQADFWPAQVYTGQFYSENTPMGIMAWRGQAVEGAGLGSKRLMGNLGDRAELGKLVKMNDWNQYTVIARGGTLIHIVNGQVMAIMVDDDPASSNNQSGLFGIEIEAITRVSVRNMWLKKLN